MYSSTVKCTIHQADPSALSKPGDYEKLVTRAYELKFKFFKVLNFYDHFKYKVSLMLLIYLAIQPSTMYSDIAEIYVSRVMKEINRTAVANIINLNMLFTGYIETVRIIASMVSRHSSMDMFCQHKYVRKSGLTSNETEQLREEFQRESAVCRLLGELRKFGLQGNKALTSTLHKLELGRRRAIIDCRDFAYFCSARCRSTSHPQLVLMPLVDREIKDAVLLMIAYEQLHEFKTCRKRPLQVEMPKGVSRSTK